MIEAALITWLAVSLLVLVVVIMPPPMRFRRFRRRIER